MDDVEGNEAVVETLSAEEVLSELEELALERGIRFAKQRALILVSMQGITKVIVRELYNANFIPLNVFQETMIQLTNRGKHLEEVKQKQREEEEKARKLKEEEDRLLKLEEDERKRLNEINKAKLLKEAQEHRAKQRLIEKSYHQIVSLCKQNDIEGVRSIVHAFDDENGDRKNLLDFQVQAIPGIVIEDRWAGSTVLMVACKLGRSEIVKFLVDEFASTNLVDSGANTALHWAAKNGHATVIRMLKHCDHDKPDAAGTTALGYAIRGCHADAVEVLLFGTNVDARDASGTTALMTASELGSWETVRKLLDYSADIDAQNGVGRTALMCAARWGKPKCCEQLLERNCEIEKRDKFGWSAVMYAARWNKIECLAILLQQMPNLNVRDRKQGWTATMYAAYHGHLKIVEMLLEAGANVHVKDIYGKTALDVGVGVQVLATLNDHLNEFPLSDHGGDESDESSLDTAEFDDYSD